MAGRVLSAAVGSLLVLVALLTAVHKCQCTCSGQVNQTKYTILSAAVYVDPACDPPSSSMRGTPNSPVTCPPRQATGATPRLTDGVLGPDNTTSPTTDYAYTLTGPSQFGLFETWIQFDFAPRISLASVTMHYYCTEQSPQLRFNDESGVVTSPVSPPCDSTAQRQCFTFSVSTSTNRVNLEVLRNNTTIYISEVKFFEDSNNTNCCTITGIPTASNQPGTQSTDHITSTPTSNGTSIRITSIATPETTSTGPPGPPSSTDTSSTVVGAVAGVVAGLVVCIAVIVLLIIVCSIFKRNQNLKKKQKKHGPEKSIVYHTTAEGNGSPEHPEETYTTLINPLYDTGKGPDTTYKPTDHHHTTVTGPHNDAVNKDSRASPSMGQSTHLTSPAADDKIKTSTDTYSVPFSDTYTVPANQTQKGGQAGESTAKELEGGGSEKSDATTGAVYAVVDKKQKGGRAMASSKERKTELPATAGAVYAVVDKKKKAPPPLPHPYQPGD